jgi:hypothetical protein
MYFHFIFICELFQPMRISRKILIAVKTHLAIIASLNYMLRYSHRTKTL